MTTQSQVDPNTGEVIQRKTFDFSTLKGAADGVPSQEEIDRQAARRFWKVGGKGFTFMPAHIVDEIISGRRELIIRSVRLGTSKFGATWFATVDYNGDTWTLPQSANDVRNALMYNIMAFINEVGPLAATIEAFGTALGTGWDFAPVEQGGDDDGELPGESTPLGEIPF